MTEELDTEQVIDLLFNGFTREGAALAVAESHGLGSEYAEALLSALSPEPYEGEAL